MAGPGARGRPRAGRRGGHRGAQGRTSSRRGCRSRSWSRPRGRRPRASAAPTSAAGPTAPASASRRRRTGRSTTRRARRRCCAMLERIQQDFNGRRRGGTQVSLADLIVLGGRRGGREGGEGRRPRRHRAVHARAHRRHAGADRRRVVRACSSRGPTGSATTCEPGEKLSPETLLLDRANLLDADAPEMTVLVGGMRALGRQRRRLEARRAHRPAGHADERLLRQPARHGHRVEAVVGRRRTSTRAATARPATSKWTATAVDLVFGSNSQLRALAEVYAGGRRRGEVRPRLRGRVGQGHGARPVRPAPLTTHTHVLTVGCIAQLRPVLGTGNRVVVE